MSVTESIKLDLVADTLKFIAGLSQSQEAAERLAVAFDYVSDAAQSIAINHALKMIADLGAAMTNVSGQMMTFANAFGMDTNFFDLAGAADSAASFDRSLLDLSATIEPTAAQLDRLRNAAMEMGAKTQYSAQQAMDAEVMLGKAGQDAEEVLASLSPTLMLAAAGQLNIAEAARIATGVMSGMGIGVDRLGQTVDVLSAAANGSKADVREMGVSFNYVASAASLAGKGLTETGSALMVLADANLKADQGGTTLEAMLLRMAAPTRRAQAAIDALGISFRDSQNNIRPLAAVVDEFKASLGGMGTADQLKYLNTIFGEQGGRGMGIMMQRGGEQLREYQAVLEASAGSAKKFADAFQNSLAGKLEAAQSAVDTFRLTLGTALIPVIRFLADNIIWLADRYTAIVKAVQNWIGWNDQAASSGKQQITFIQTLGKVYEYFREAVVAIYADLTQGPGENQYLSAVGRGVVSVLALLQGVATEIGSVVATIGSAIGSMLAPAIEGVVAVFQGFGFVLVDANNILKSWGIDLIALIPTISSWSDALFIATNAATVFFVALSALLTLKTVASILGHIILLIANYTGVVKLATFATAMLQLVSGNWWVVAGAIAAASAVALGITYAFKSAETAASQATGEMKKNVDGVKQAIGEVHEAAKDPLKLKIETEQAAKKVADLAKMANDFNREQHFSLITLGRNSTDVFKAKYFMAGGEEKDIATGLKFAALMEKEKRQMELANDAAELTNKLQEQIATFGMTADAAERYRLSVRGATEEQLAGAAAAEERLRKLNEEKKALDQLAKDRERAKEELERKVTDFKASIQSPIEKFEADAANLFQMLKDGSITERQYQLGVDKLKQDHDIDRKPQPVMLASVEDLSKRLQEAALKGQDDKEQKRLQLQERANQLLAEMDQTLKDLGKLGLAFEG